MEFLNFSFQVKIKTIVIGIFLASIFILVPILEKVSAAEPCTTASTCGTAFYEYRCSGNFLRQRRYIDYSCVYNRCVTNYGSWVTIENCQNNNFYEYICSGQWKQRRLLTSLCGSGSTKNCYYIASGWINHKNCGSSGYEYRCSGQWRQRRYVTRGCSINDCYASYGSWVNNQDCGSNYYEYRCSGQWRQRRLVSRGCSGNSCYTTYGSWTNYKDCGSNYYEYRCSGNKRQRRLVSRGCSGTTCSATTYGSWKDYENCESTEWEYECLDGFMLRRRLVTGVCSNKSCSKERGSWGNYENCHEDWGYEYRCDPSKQYIQKRYKKVCSCPKNGPCSCSLNNGAWSNSENCFITNRECREINGTPQCVPIPSVDNLSWESPWDQYCGASDPIIRLFWEFIPSKYFTEYLKEDDGDRQEKYKIIIKKERSNRILKEITGGAEENYSIEYDKDIEWGESYDWEVEVKGEYNDFYSKPKSMSFQTPPHQYPYPGGFWWSTDSRFFTTEALVTFHPSLYEDHCFGSCSYEWNIQDAVYQEGTSYKSKNPRVKFTKPGIKEITLTIIDNELKDQWGPGACSSTKNNLSITYPLPRWQEIPPFLGSISNFTKNVVNYVKDIFLDKNY